MLADAGGHQQVYYEDFQDGDGNEHFLDRYCTDGLDDPLQALMNTGFRSAVIEAIEALPGREKILMGLYYVQEMNLKETAAGQMLDGGHASSLMQPAAFLIVVLGTLDVVLM